MSNIERVPILGSGEVIGMLNTCRPYLASEEITVPVNLELSEKVRELIRAEVRKALQEIATVQGIRITTSLRTNESPVDETK